MGPSWLAPADNPEPFFDNDIISPLTLDCTPRWGLGPSSWLSGRKFDSQFPWPQLFFVTTFISSFSPSESRLHTAMGIGPLIVAVRQKDREFLGTPPSSFRSPLMFRWRLQRRRAWDPWQCSSVTAKYDHHLSASFYYDLSLAGNLGLRPVSQNSRKNPTSPTSSFRVTSTTFIQSTYVLITINS